LKEGRRLEERDYYIGNKSRNSGVRRGIWRMNENPRAFETNSLDNLERKEELVAKKTCK